jgi:hypothetical protein
VPVPDATLSSVGVSPGRFLCSAFGIFDRAQSALDLR